MYNVFLSIGQKILMIIEIHCHGRPHKYGISKADKFCKIAKEMCIDALIFTEHAHTASNNFWTTENIESLQLKHGVSILIGQEISTDIGDILVYNYPYVVKDRMNITDIIVDEDWAIVAAHPCRKGGLERIRPYVGKFDAIEIMNKSYSAEDCSLAISFAFEHGLGMVGSSDIHLNRHIGICPCHVPSCNSIRDFVSHIKSRQVVPLSIKFR